MATTIVTVTNVYEQVLASTDLAWSMQNTSDNKIFVREDASLPAADVRGFILESGQRTTHTELGVGDYWVRNAGAGSYSNAGTEPALQAGRAAPTIAITK